MHTEVKRFALVTQKIAGATGPSTYRMGVTNPGLSGWASVPIRTHDYLQTCSGPHWPLEFTQEGCGSNLFFLNPLLCTGPLNFDVAFNGVFSSFVEI